MITWTICAALALLVGVGCAFDNYARKQNKALDEYRGREHWL